MRNDDGVVRRFAVGGALRAEASPTDFRSLLRGMAIVFNSRSEDLGGWVEIITPKAMDRTINEKIDLRALVDHDTGKIIGRLSAGTLKVRKETDGLAVEIEPPNTTIGRDIVEVVRRGDVTGMSFAFRLMPGGIQWDWDQDPPVRYVTDMRVSEVSVVTFPAYTETDIEVGKRTLEEARRTRGPSVSDLRGQLAAKSARWT